MAKDRKNSETESIRFMQFPATLVQLAEKPPPPKQPKREKILRLNLSISCDLQQLWFSWQKRPPPHGQRGKNSETESIHFMQFPATLVQLEENPPSPQQPKREKILRLNLSISCNFQQLWFSWKKIPPPLPAAKEGENSETEFICFMQFHATLVQLAGKAPPTTQAVKEGKNSETESIRFMQFPTTLVQLADPHSDSSYPNI